MEEKRDDAYKPEIERRSKREMYREECNTNYYCDYILFTTN
jgi:hypothetical protein